MKYESFLNSAILHSNMVDHYKRRAQWFADVERLIKAGASDEAIFKFMFRQGTPKRLVAEMIEVAKWK